MLICPHIVLSWWHLTAELHANPFWQRRKRRRGWRRRRRRKKMLMQQSEPVAQSPGVTLCWSSICSLRATSSTLAAGPSEKVLAVVLWLCVFVCAALLPHWAKPNRAPPHRVNLEHWARTGLILIPQSYFSVNLTSTKHGKDQHCALRVRVQRQTRGQSSRMTVKRVPMKHCLFINHAFTFSRQNPFKRLF